MKQSVEKHVTKNVSLRVIFQWLVKVYLNTLQKGILKPAKTRSLFSSCQLENFLGLLILLFILHICFAMVK